VPKQEPNFGAIAGMNGDERQSDRGSLRRFEQARFAPFARVNDRFHAFPEIIDDGKLFGEAQTRALLPARSFLRNDIGDIRVSRVLHGQ
jgi:hypothetical protein